MKFPTAEMWGITIKIKQNQKFSEKWGTWMGFESNSTNFVLHKEEIYMRDLEQQEKMKKYYDTSKYYNNDVFTDLKSPFQKYRISKVFQIYTPTKRERVLDLGCGWGTFCFAAAPTCDLITGVDYSEKSIALCNKLLSKSHNPNIDFVCVDAQDTKFESESYDVIICADLFEHLYPEVFENVLDECRRLLKKGGKLVIWTPHRGHILEILKNNNIILKKDVSHVDYKSMNLILETLCTKQFSIKKKYYVESHIPLLCYIEKRLLYLIPLLRRRIAILAEK